jgi:phosphoglycerate kinase
MKTIKDVSLSEKRVLIRVDFNVPLDSNKHITDDARIRAVLPTLRYAIDRHAKLIIASHLGRPKGKVAPDFSLYPVAVCLQKLLGKEVTMAPDCIGSDVSAMVSAMKSGEILLLENLRFHPEEERNDAAFAKALAGLCDIYVNDAFAVSHRAHASVEGITAYAPVCAAGFLLEKEMTYFDKAMTNPQHPLVAIIGGAKVSSKLEALNNMLSRVDKFIIGGAMANTFLKSTGVDVGTSLVEEDLLESAKSIMAASAENKVKFYLPVDAVVARKPDEKGETKTVPIQEIPDEWMALDIGPATTLLFSEALHNAKTIIWNGPMGVFEMDAYAKGTMAMARSVANADAITIAGGGDTDAALHRSGEMEKITYISTGGGAFLALLEGKKLPAIEALDRAEGNR